MKNSVIVILILLAGNLDLSAQISFFSQSRFSSTYMNPAYAAFSSYGHLDALHRNQQAAEDFSIRSSLLSFTHPFINSQQKAWSGFGVTFMDDRSGSGGIFQVQKFSLQYAIKAPLSSQYRLALGINSNFEQRKFSLQGLYTGSQYIPGRGFNEGLESGETPDDFRQQIFSFGSGLLLEADLQNGKPLGEFGIVLTDIYQNTDGVFGGQIVNTPGIILHGQIHLTGPTALSLDPSIRMLFNNYGSEIHLGGTWNYALADLQKIAIVTEYVIGRQAILGIQFFTEKIGVGFSYDITFDNRPGNQGAFEFGLTYRWKRKHRSRSEGKMNRFTVPNQTPLGINQIFVSERYQLPEFTIEPVESSIKGGYPGEIDYYPISTNAHTLHFNYSLNSEIPDSGYLRALESIAQNLINNERVLHITGHTDSSGSDEYNLMLSRKRADHIRVKLIEMGIPASRIITDGKGEREPLPNGTPEQNRRVEFIYVEK